MLLQPFIIQKLSGQPEQPVKLTLIRTGSVFSGLQSPHETAAEDLITPTSRPTNNSFVLVLPWFPQAC